MHVVFINTLRINQIARIRNKDNLESHYSYLPKEEESGLHCLLALSITIITSDYFNNYHTQKEDNLPSYVP